MIELFAIALGTVAGLLVLAGLLHAAPRLGGPGRAGAVAAARAPLLDVLIVMFTLVPQVAGAVIGRALLRDAWGVWPAGVGGVLSALAGQMIALGAWMRLHEFAHRDAMRGPRIKTTMNGIMGGGAAGAWRNGVAVWWTLSAVHVFTIVRVTEMIVYPPLTWLVRLPRYKDAEWVSVSRHKFRGLVGADRIWCLYCDWMTGVWSLGSEMLRNVESFWCPIRFADAGKCEKCRVDFPDVATDWAAAEGTMADVEAVLRRKYPGPGANSWYGHPARLTVGGEAVSPEVPAGGRA